MTSYDPNLVKLIRTIVQASIDESQRKSRIPGTIAGVVEALDADLDVIYVRVDQTQSDPLQSDNFEDPGVLAVTRYGETFPGETARITFDSIAATANAMRTGIENKIVLPYGTEVGQRIILDGNEGAIGFFDEQDQLTAFLDTLQWFVGKPGGALARLDPLGGLRLWDADDHLRIAAAAEEGIQVRDGGSGITAVSITAEGITVADPATGETISIAGGTTSSVPTPHWASSFGTSATTSHSTPATASFGTGDDLDLRFVSASADNSTGAQDYTPPAGYTEIADADTSDARVTLAVAAAYKDPAAAVPAVANFTSSTTLYERRNGHSVIVRGGGGSSPFVRATEVGPSRAFISTTITLDIDAPPTVADGDLMVAYVSLAGKAIPTTWKTPKGWAQLGLQSAGAGTAHMLGTGIWIKPYKTGDPTTETVTIYMTEAAYTRVQPIVVAVANPYRYPTGLDIKRNNRSMPRGLIARSVGTATMGPYSTTQNAIVALNDVDMLAGRTYEIALHMPHVTLSTVTAGHRWRFDLIKNGNLTTPIGSFGVISSASLGVMQLPVSTSIIHIPTADEVVDWTVRATLINDGGTVEIVSSATQPREMRVFDLGAVY